MGAAVSLRRPLFLAAAVVLAFAACSSGMSLSEYADEVDRELRTMNRDLDELYTAAAAANDLGTTQQYMIDRVQLRYNFIDDLAAIDPPGEVAELHQAARDIVQRLAEAEAALSDRLQRLEIDMDIDSIWLLPEGLAAVAADADAVALCRSAQSTLDRTEIRAALGDVPWVPPEMKEVVLVNFNCISGE
jgi:hypothetical protein